MAQEKLPRFASEAEEAKWWFQHRSDIAKDILKASKTGRLGEGSRARALRRIRPRRNETSPARVDYLIAISPDDIEKSMRAMALHVFPGESRVTVMYSITAAVTDTSYTVLRSLRHTIYSTLRVPMQNPLT